MRHALVVSLLLVPALAEAHAPVVRNALALASGDTLVTVPGFGLVLGNDDSGFAYLCDAALGSGPSDADYALLERPDGALLIGTSAGLRLRDGVGCPLAQEADNTLHGAPTTALTRARDGRLFAATAGPVPQLQASADGGVHWQRLTELPVGSVVSDLVLVNDELVASLGAPGQSQRVRFDLVRATATSDALDAGLRLLAASPDAEGPLWGLRRAADGSASRGFELVRAPSLDGPFTAVQYLDYFGGFARAADGALWLGDAGGHLYRSDDGTTFTDVAPGFPASCVAPRAGGVDACTLSSPGKPSLSHYDVTKRVLGARLALADVARLATCADLDVAALCSAAWAEWNRDARLLVGDAGVPPDAALPTEPAPSAPPPPEDDDAGPSATVTAKHTGAGAGCALGSRGVGPWAGLAWFVLYSGRRRRATARRLKINA